MDRKVDGLSLKTDHYSLFYFTGQVVIIVMGPGDCWLVHSVAYKNRTPAFHLTVKT